MQFHVGVIGATGYIGTPYREEIRQCPVEEARIVTLCARRRDPLEAAAAEDQAERVTTDWRNVVRDPDVNLVLVLTPDALHYDAVMEAAAAGKHVFCEKPVGVNAEQAERMWAAVRDAGLAHYVPYWTRYVPVFAKARALVQAGVLGRIRGVVYRWHNPRPLTMPFTWRDDAALSAAGSIADVGSHAYDAMRWILGEEATQVLAHADVITPAKADLGEINLDEALTYRGPASADAPPTRKGTAFDYASISFRWKSEAVGVLVLSHAPYFRKGLAPELELHGEDASLALDRATGTLTRVEPDGAPEVIATEPMEGFGNRFAKHVFPALRAQLAGEAHPHPDLEDGWRVQRFTDAAAESARSGGWADV